MLSLSSSYATYKLIDNNGAWLIFCNDEFVGGFAERYSAVNFVEMLVEARCVEHKASQVLIDTNLGCEKHLCRCFKEAPPGTPLS
ncbi:hypothetical protein IC232_11160 [Microvirga sp. BT688]|uniref:hypothetical protein n=1 Tax=Microvirga sp. TaxID=1873136 RepID=UPI001688B6AA|nr:hypothetical protein [Microvirga sp.]MBD2747252.1 hypothetical protein [Microvirga sp.]